MALGNKVAYRKIINSLVSYNLSSKVEKIKQPILVISSRKDNIIPLDLQQKFVLKLNDPKHRIIKGRHAVAIDNFSRVNKLIEDFLSQN